MAERVEFGMALLLMAAALTMLVRLDTPYLLEGGVSRLFAGLDLSSAAALCGLGLWLRSKAS